ncbi:MAG: indole-3-glycerol phosphate synthase TrpC [Aureispira sp.]|nr:indole-3-glycerol phosphate synthase TrpC [Aureispira sp.]
MKNILEKIVAYKKEEIQKRKELYPTKLLEQSIYFETPVVSLSQFIQRPDKQGIIAEFKRQSPSKGPINPYATVEEVSIGYMQGGASALSVLTDTHFFGGKNEDLTTARKFNYAPILNKNFVIDEYQVIEAKSIGADAVLLIAECLTAGELQNLAQLAQQLGMEVLMEIHTAKQLSKLCPAVNLVGINNRDLNSFEVNIEQSLEIAALLPAHLPKISESGINDPATVVYLKKEGFDGFLIGEHFMQDAYPGRACAEFIHQIELLTATAESTVKTLV